MSGGYFNYIQSKLREVMEEIQDLMDSGLYSSAVVDKMNEGLRAVQIAECFITRIDWLASCDDGEESFLERLDYELDKVIESWQQGDGK